ncbi:MAG: PfkB family carbohydrate kinase, partial [Pseudomonadota bacterium]
STAAAVLCRETAEAAGVKTCISISDTSMVEFCREGLEAMLGNGVDCLFCNEIEALGWAGTDRLDIAVAELKDIGRELYVTLGANGCRVITRDGDREVAGVAAKAVDTTGAGDMFAGACLYARMQDADPADATRFANYSAANIVSRYGARLENADAYQQLKAAYIP